MIFTMVISQAALRVMRSGQTARILDLSCGFFNLNVEIQNLIYKDIRARGRFRGLPAPVPQRGLQPEASKANKLRALTRKERAAGSETKADRNGGPQAPARAARPQRRAERDSAADELEVAATQDERMPRPRRRDVAPVLGAHKWGLARCRLLECALGGLKLFTPGAIEGVVLAPPECILLQLVLWAILPIGNLTLYMQNQSLSPLYRACVAALFTSAGVVALRLVSFALGRKEATNKALTGSGRAHSRSRTNRSGARVAILPPSSEPRQTQKFLDHERTVSPTISDARENRCLAAIRFSCAPTTLDADGCRDVARRLGVGAFLSFVFIFSVAREESAWSASGSLSRFLRVLSWTSFGMALYCVAVRHPVELAQWLPHSQVTDFAMRASHVVLACACCGLRTKPGVIAILPVLWMLGLVPCPQALAEWCLEMLTLHVFGGSAASSSTRVVTNFTISLVTSCLSIAFFYGFGPIGGKIAAAWLGAMLSQGVLQNARMRNAEKTSLSPRMALSRRFLFPLAMCCAAGFGAFSPHISWKISICITGGIFAIQTAFSLLPFLRPRAWKARQDVAFSMANVYLLATGMFRQPVPDLSALKLCSLGVLTLRNVRVASTSPETASVEILLAISAEGLLNSIQGPWRFVFLSYTLSIRAAAVGWLLFVAREALENFCFMGVHTWTALRDPKLRLPKGARALCIIAAPVWNPAMAVLAAVFGSPFVPVAGAGVFVAGFPRPRRLWASCLPTRGSSPEAGYYQQMLPRLLDSLVKEPAALHSASRFGSTVFLVRFEKMIAWIQILEHEAGYSIAHVKGLEMQEPTSCHNVEANYLDALLERNRRGITVHPICKLDVQTYSHAQVGLVGVMGSPDMAHLLHRCIGYVLAWKLVHEGKEFQQKVYELIVPETSLTAHLGNDSTDQLKSWVNFLCENRISAAASPLLEYKRTWKTNDFHQGPMGPIGPLGDDFDIDVLLDELDDAELSSEDDANDDSAAFLAKDALAAELAVHRQSHSREHQVSPESPHQLAVWPSSPDASHVSRTGLLPEIEKTSTKKVGPAFGSKTPFVSTSIQSREKEGALPRPESSQIDKCSQQASPRTTAMPLPLPERPCDVPIACPRSPVVLSSPEEILNSPMWSQGSPLPPPPLAVETIETPTALHEAHNYTSHSRPEISTFPSGQAHENTAGDLHAKTSPARCMSIPDSAPNRIRSLRAYDQDSHQGEEEECELRDEDPSRIVEVLKRAQNILGSEARLLSAQYVLEKFRGDSTLSSTFRTAVKLALDALLVGDPDASLVDFKACATALESYTREWFMGPEDDSDWEKAIQRECLHMLSLAERKEHQFGSGLQLLQLSLQRESASLCLVQSSVVRGIWAALTMELVFFANDDDERYSIQAHPTFLRNMIIQGAEPPLGYPVFCSGPVLIPRL